jgi:glycosyltransferase involved in cell wall biosynthesis
VTVTPLVSVLLTTYQHAAFIDDAIKSTLDQSYRNLEVVVADDGSTDGAQERIRRWASVDARVVPLLSEINRGLSANWNRGLRRCRGEFVAVLSGDDLMLPERIAKQVAFLQAHPECGVCSHDMEVFDSATGRELYRLNDRFASKHGGQEVNFTTNWWSTRDVKSIPSSHMFRGSAVAGLEYDSRLNIMNEWLFEIDCMATSGLRWGSLPDVLGRYRTHAHQSSRSDEAVSRGFEETMIVLAVASARYPELAPLTKNKRDFVVFRHLVFGWFPEDKRAACARQFRLEAGLGKWLYMSAARLLVRSRWLLHASRPARRFMRWLQHRA